MDCKEFEESILDPEHRPEQEAHAASCEACRRMWEDWEALDHALSQRLTPPRMSPRARAALWGRIGQAPRLAGRPALLDLVEDLAPLALAATLLAAIAITVRMSGYPIGAFGAGWAGLAGAALLALVAAEAAAPATPGR